MHSPTNFFFSLAVLNLHYLSVVCYTFSLKDGISPFLPLIILLSFLPFIWQGNLHFLRKSSFFIPFSASIQPLVHLCDVNLYLVFLCQCFERFLWFFDTDMVSTQMFREYCSYVTPYWMAFNEWCWLRCISNWYLLLNFCLYLISGKSRSYSGSFFGSSHTV